jgi:hypothetical protein
MAWDAIKSAYAFGYAGNLLTIPLDAFFKDDGTPYRLARGVVRPLGASMNLKRFSEDHYVWWIEKLGDLFDEESLFTELNRNIDLRSFISDLRLLEGSADALLEVSTVEWDDPGGTSMRAILERIPPVYLDRFFYAITGDPVFISPSILRNEFLTILNGIEAITGAVPGLGRLIDQATIYAMEHDGFLMIWKDEFLG